MLQMHRFVQNTWVLVRRNHTAIHIARRMQAPPCLLCQRLRSVSLLWKVFSCSVFVLVILFPKCHTSHHITSSSQCTHITLREPSAPWALISCEEVKQRKVL